MHAAEHQPWLHRYAAFVAAATFLLIVAGGLVTSTRSGLAVPDWPLSYGMVFPPMVGGIFYEHGHRMVAASVGMLTIVLAVWLWRAEARRWLRWLGVIALGAVIFQGVLGGITVLFLLPMPVSVFHASLAQSFFCLTMALALFTSRWWREAPRMDDAGAPSLRAMGLIAALGIFAQLVLGAVVRHMNAGLAIPDFPLLAGRGLPPLEGAAAALHFAHRAWALGVLALVAWTLARTLRAGADFAPLRRTAWLMFALVLLQGTLGALSVLTRLAVLPTTAHVANGALLLACSVLYTLQAWRCARPASSGAAAILRRNEAAA